MPSHRAESNHDFSCAAFLRFGPRQTTRKPQHECCFAEALIGLALLSQAVCGIVPLFVLDVDTVIKFAWLLLRCGFRSSYGENNEFPCRCTVVVSVIFLIEKLMNLLGCCSIVVSVRFPVEKLMNLLGCCSVVVAVRVLIENAMSFLVVALLFVAPKLYCSFFNSSY